MAILVAKKVWRRERTKPRLHAQLAALTPAEQANVLAFAKTLRARCHSWEAFARRVGVQRLTLFRACTGIQDPCAGLALRLARMAKVPIEAVLGGSLARAGRCAVCGK
jgi:DNA-binding XRE family transcriptional regulator